MEELRTYLNSLDRSAQDEYAKRCGTSVAYLRNALSTGKRFDGALCRKLDEHSRGKVRRETLRPDIWPELVKRKRAA